MADLPRYYFRLRENGALVYRVTPDDRRGRLGLDQIAAVNLRNGELRPHGDRPLTPEDRAEIEAWIARRRADMARREWDEMQRSVEVLNLTAQWAQSRATDAQLEDLSDALMLAMHDLRTVLIRKRAERLGREDQA